jgi:hypothetical protein
MKVVPLVMERMRLGWMMLGVLDVESDVIVWMVWVKNYRVYSEEYRQGR